MVRGTGEDNDGGGAGRENKRRKKTDDSDTGLINFAIPTDRIRAHRADHVDDVVDGDGAAGDGAAGAGARSSSATKEKPANITDTYQASLDHESWEAQTRTEEEDQELVTETITHIRSLMKEILKLKQDKPEQWSSDVEERRVQVLMLMLSLRRLSRVQKVRVRDSRERTAEARQSVDGVTLKLQNLLYEVAHLKKEVRRCLDFQSADQEIDLVPVEQFYIEAPEDISRPGETAENPHEQRLARLQWELEQRRGQTQLFDKLTREKEAVAETINQQERKLASLAPRITTILEATRPLQEALDLPIDAKKEQQRIVQLLPSPLYTLWVQAAAYGEAFDSNIKVDVIGDVDAAKKLIAKDEDSRTENLSDSDNDQEVEQENLSRKKRSRKTQKQDADDIDDGVKQMMSLHPLFVKITVSTKDGNSVALSFYYMQTLRIVTVKCSIHLLEKTKAALTDVISSDTLLNCLFADDDGESSPNPANHFQLSRLHISLHQHLATTGRPYKWAQNLAGLAFSSLKQISEDSQDTSVRGPSPSSITAPPGGSGDNTGSGNSGGDVVVWQDSAEQMPITILALRRRLQARLAIHLQLNNLETVSSTSAINLPADLIRQHFPGKICSELKSWLPMSWSDYSDVPTTQLLRDSRVVTPQHLFFKAILERKHVRLDALVAVSPDHPNVVPVFSLQLHWNGQHHADNNPQLRQMEKEVNVHWDELVSCRTERLQLLPLLLMRLAVCLDVFTEAHSAHPTDTPPDFHKEKIFFRPARGPDRAFPFKYHPKLGVFSQR